MSAPKTPEPPTPFYTWFAVALAGLASAGGVYLYLEGKEPCPLCYYQRSFAYATLAILLAGLLGGFNEKFAVAALALPVAFAGLGVALWHVNLERTGVLECPPGAFGMSTAPKQSAIVFGLCCAALVLDAYQAGRLGGSYQHVLGGAAAGIVVAAACAFTNPPPPDAPKDKPYADEVPKTCRRPYVEAKKE